MRSRMISMALLSALVGGCAPAPHNAVVGGHHFVCIDGVEYFNDGEQVPPRNPTPHLKPDGKPYSCNY
jgi:hypothetical protein